MGCNRRVAFFERAVLGLLSLHVGCGGRVDSLAPGRDSGAAVLAMDGAVDGSWRPAQTPPPVALTAVDATALPVDVLDAGTVDVDANDLAVTPPPDGSPCVWYAPPGPGANNVTCDSISSFTGDPVVCVGFRAANGTLSQCLTICGRNFADASPLSCELSISDGNSYFLYCTYDGTPCYGPSQG
jgi:hypothetical protein